jgi:arylsulfatase A-like enzyme
MAREGVMFKTAWATPMCSPTRAMIMTGRYGNRTGFYHNALRLVNSGERANLVKNNLTFGKLLQDAGYATAIAGKWHVTGDAPHSESGGFDEHSLWIGKNELEALPDKPAFDGLWENEDTTSRYWHPCIMQNHELVDTSPDDFATKIHTDFLCDFIERKKDEPFLAYFPMAAPHGTRQGHTTTPLRGEVGEFKKVRGKEQEERFKALNEYIDVCVGQIVETVERLGLHDRTMIIFTSDNGTAVTAKTRAVERGARVPFVVYGGGIKKRGETQELMDLSDVLPTMLDYAGVRLPSGYEIDGQSLMPFLQGETDSHREWIYSYIATSQMMRTKRWLLEAVNPVLGLPRGRFYDCGNNRERKGYKNVTDSTDPEVLTARKRFDEVLSQFPPVQKDHPYFETRAGKRFMEAYTKPEAIEKHLHNHRNYEYSM